MNGVPDPDQGRTGAVFDVEAANLFDMRRVSDREWVIYDLRVAPNDARCVVACVWLTDDDDVEVVWLDGRALPTRYASVDAVMDDVTASAQRTAGGTRPIEIPSLPPRRLVG
jgi:hypothetical protein